MTQEEECPLCIEKYTKRGEHKPITCHLCKFTACTSCTQRFLLDAEKRILPQCMNNTCRVEWKREFLLSVFTKTFVNNQLKKHKEDILFEREKSFEPSTMNSLKLAMVKREKNKSIQEIKKELDKIRGKQQNLLSNLNDIENEMRNYYFLKYPDTFIQDLRRNSVNIPFHIHDREDSKYIKKTFNIIEKFHECAKNIYNHCYSRDQNHCMIAYNNIIKLQELIKESKNTIHFSQQFDENIKKIIQPNSITTKQLTICYGNIQMELEKYKQNFVKGEMLTTLMDKFKETDEYKKSYLTFQSLEKEQNEVRKKLNEVSKIIRDSYWNQAEIRTKYRAQQQLATPTPTITETEPGKETEEKEEKEKKHLTIHCPTANCGGYLNSKWKCDICGTKVCSKCNAIKSSLSLSEIEERIKEEEQKSLDDDDCTDIVNIINVLSNYIEITSSICNFVQTYIEKMKKDELTFEQFFDNLEKKYVINKEHVDLEKLKKEMLTCEILFPIRIKYRINDEIVLDIAAHSHSHSQTQTQTHSHSQTQTPYHICLREDVESVDAIKKDSKKCPNCGECIEKISGCDQMWCTSCHTGFSWKTGNIVKGRLHNPHYFEYINRNKSEDLQTRNVMDIRCGGLPDYVNLIQHLFNVGVLDIPTSNRNFYTIQNISNFMDFHNLRRAYGGYMLKSTSVLLEYSEFNSLIARMYSSLIDIQDLLTGSINRETDVNDTGKNLDNRILYMLREIDEAKFKHLIQMREKRLEKYVEIGQIYNMILSVCTDLYNNIIGSQNPDEIRNIFLVQFYEIRKHFNICMYNVSSIFDRAVLPHIDGKWIFTHNTDFKLFKINSKKDDIET